MKKLIKFIVIVLVLGAIGYGIRFWLTNAKSPEKIAYTTREVTQGPMQSTISSTGTVEPEELVNVGAQVNGMILRFGIDADGKAVDYGSKVKAGMLLAQIDQDLFIADRDTNKAQVEQEKAAITIAEANLLQSESEYKLALQNKERADQLHPKGIMSKSDYDTCQKEYTLKKASKALAEAAIVQAKAKLAAGEAALAKSERNLRYTVITSPVDGVIIDRRVNIGQTVNASMNAPSLFLIAKDLRRMQVWVSVNEADIGRIHPGQRVIFTVDAFRGKTFVGEVRKVRLNATMSQNIVTYVVEINTDNSSGILLPYLTANVKFILAERANAVMVPNAAFRYTPQNASEAPVPGKGERLVWVLEAGNRITPKIVRVGLNDGSCTEVLEGLKPGEKAVTGSRILTGKESNASKAGQAKSTSPFLPAPPHRQGARKKP